jgi:hypothetical protein
MGHFCINDTYEEDGWWEYDAQGIPLCKVCDKCRDQKLSRYRPEILEGYTQADVDEPIEPEPEVGPLVFRDGEDPPDWLKP